MADSNDKQSKTDDLISSYLGDLLGARDPVVNKDASVSVEGDALDLEYEAEAPIVEPIIFAAPSIARNKSLISTYDILAIADAKTISSKPQAFLMLLISLYYLRRPLSRRVRDCFLMVSERMLDDYEAADWQAQIKSTGVLSEARS